MLYWVAVIEKPKMKKKDEETISKLGKLIIEPICVVARDEKDAALRVAISNEKLKGVDPDYTEIVVRPF